MDAISLASLLTELPSNEPADIDALFSLQYERRGPVAKAAVLASENQELLLFNRVSSDRFCGTGKKGPQGLCPSKPLSFKDDRLIILDGFTLSFRVECHRQALAQDGDELDGNLDQHQVERPTL